MMMLGLKIDILNEKTELMVPGEGVVDHWWCGGIHRVQPGMIKLFRRRTAAAAFYNIYSEAALSYLF